MAGPAMGTGADGSVMLFEDIELQDRNAFLSLFIILIYNVLCSSSR